jgi:hypothetical protein
MATSDYTLTLTALASQTGQTAQQTIDLSAYVATMAPSWQRRAVRTITAIDGTEYAFPASRKHGLTVTMKPMTGAQIRDLYAFLANTSSYVWYQVTYKAPTSTNADNTITVPKMRIANEFELAYLLKSVDGNRYYNGVTLELREQ